MGIEGWYDDPLGRRDGPVQPPRTAGGGLPPPIIRSGADDPIGLPPAVAMVRYGVHYWLAAVLLPAVVILEVLWLGDLALGSAFVWPLLALSVVLLIFNVPSVLRGRSMARGVLRQAGSRGEPIPALPRLLSGREAFGVAVVAAEWALLIALLAR